MKKLLILCCIFLCTISTTQAQEWLTDFDKAKKIASEQNKKIILVFQGSDWSALCKRLDKELWSNAEFLEHAKANYVMLKADFPRRRENFLSKEQQDKNEALINAYNRQRLFPHIVVLNSKGEEQGFTGYKKVKTYQFIELLDFFKASH